MSIAFTRELVLKKLADTFPDPVVAQQALGSLDRYGKGEYEPAANYVHLQILKASEGKLWRLRELVQIARHDYRDIAYEDESPEEKRKRAETRELILRGARLKKLSPSQKAAMEKKRAASAKRRTKEWIEWLSS